MSLTRSGRHYNTMSADQENMEAVGDINDTEEGDSVNLGEENANRDQQLTMLQAMIHDLMMNHETTHKAILTIGSHLKSSMEPQEGAESNMQGEPAVVSSQSQNSEQNAPSARIPPNLMIPRDLSFAGSLQENTGAFLDKLERHCNLLGLSNTHKAQIFPLLIRGLALSWYNDLGSSVQDSWTLLRQACMDKFGPKARGMSHTTALLDFKQGPTQSIDHYVTEMVKRFEMCDATAERRLEAFINGLKPDIKAYVVEKEPETFQEAEKFARKREEVQRIRFPTQTLAAIDLLLAETGKSPTTVESLQSQLNAVTETIAELKRRQDQHPRQRTPSPTRRSTDGQRDDREDSRPSTERKPPHPRTTEGRPRCQRCGKVGHYTDRCRTRERPRCYNCNRTGHFASECRSASRPYCTYCNMAGHTQASCRTRQRQEQSYRQPPHVPYYQDQQAPHGQYQAPQQLPGQGNY